MDWTLLPRLAMSLVVSVVFLVFVIGINVVSEVWLAGAIALEPLIGTAWAGIIMVLPIAAIVYVFLYGIRRGR